MGNPVLGQSDGGKSGNPLQVPVHQGQSDGGKSFGQSGANGGKSIFAVPVGIFSQDPPTISPKMSQSVAWLKISEIMRIQFKPLKIHKKSFLKTCRSLVKTSKTFKKTKILEFLRKNWYFMSGQQPNLPFPKKLKNTICAYSMTQKLEMDAFFCTSSVTVPPRFSVLIFFWFFY